MDQAVQLLKFMVNFQEFFAFYPGFRGNAPDRCRRQKEETMKNRKRRALAVLLALCMALGLTAHASAVSDAALEAAFTDTAQYVYKTVKSPQVGSVGGEWAVLGLARSGYEIPETYYQNYYAAVEGYVRACGGVLHEKKYTEYARVIVALSSIGKDARDVAGYDLTKPLGDFEKTVWQGVNGPIWALIALDSRSYPMPVNTQAKTQATRQMYLDEILSRQLSDGGWNLTGTGSVSDPDITGMALQALAKYQDQPAVKKATEEALACMSAQQTADGGFSPWGTASSECVVQMLVALCELGLPLDDSRFVKNGNSMLDNLMSYYRRFSGFQHTKSGGGSSQMASEQGFYALVAVRRAAQGKNSLYRMSDAITVSTSGQQPGTGLPGKHGDVQARQVTAAGRTYPDISGENAHANQGAMEALSAREILNGKTDGLFHPDDTMTRAQFAAVVVRALGLPLTVTDTFSDVGADAWCAGYVGAAYHYGIVNGKTATTFQPNGTITRQEAAVMVARAAKLCGLDTSMDAAAVRDVLAPFGDYVTVGEWARPSMAFCYQSGILDDAALDIQPKAATRRCEIAQMVYNLLAVANLL